MGGGRSHPGRHADLLGVERRQPGHHVVHRLVERVGARERGRRAPRFGAGRQRVHHGGGAGDGLLGLPTQRLGFDLGLGVLGDRAEIAARRPRGIAGAQGALGVLHDGLGEDQGRHVVLHRTRTPGPVAGRER